MWNSFYLLLVVIFLVAHPASAQIPGVPASREEITLSFAPLVRTVAPAVVNIYAQRVVVRRSQHPIFSDPLFAPFFAPGFNFGMPRERAENSLGSGVIVDAKGLVVTNAHVVKDAQEIVVALPDGREFAADLKLIDTPSDLAVLKIRQPDGDLPFARLRGSDTLAVGDLVLAIGNPFGVGQTVTSGIVSALSRAALNVNDFNFFIQTDAAINPGNSGGPLVAMDGSVVGINTAIYSRDGGSLGIGFAVPSEMVMTVLEAAQKDIPAGSVAIARPWFGVTTQDISQDIAVTLGLKKPEGVLITALHPASPLRAKNIQVGDRIIGVNNTAIRNGDEWRFRTATARLGDELTLDVVSKNGMKRNITLVTIAPPDDPPRAPYTLKGNHVLKGVTVARLNPSLAIALGLPDQETGIVVTSLPQNSIAARFLRVGTIIRALNGSEISNPADVEKLAATPTPQGWVAVIVYGGQQQTLVLR